MKHSIPVSLSLFLAGFGTITAAEDYRLAGTMALADGDYLAIIEMPAGEQRIFHVGDTFESGVVARITGSHVSIDLPGDYLVLSLEGKASDADAEIPQGPVVASLELDDQQLKSIGALRGYVEQELVAALSERLALPQGLRVQMIRVSLQEFGSLVDALPAMRKALARGEAPHLFFEPGSGLDEVYLMPRPN